MGGRPVRLLRSVDAARRAVAALVGPDVPVLLPPNVTPALLEALKRSRTRFGFGTLDASLNLHGDNAVAWAEPVLGMPTTFHGHAQMTILDHGDVLPLGRPHAETRRHDADIIIYSLQLDADPERAGALAVFREARTALQLDRLLRPTDRLDDHIAQARLHTLQQLTPRQLASLALVHEGVEEAAGLESMNAGAAVALTQGVPVRIPAEAAPTTFTHYARGENTPVAWLPELRPLHYAAAARGQTSAAHLERWLLLPVRPDDDCSVFKQTVLGVVKAAEYLGVRFRTDPARAVEYAALLDAMYGSGHDAYRPVFSVFGAAGTGALDAADLQAPACRISARRAAVPPDAVQIMGD